MASARDLLKGMYQSKLQSLQANKKGNDIFLDFMGIINSNMNLYKHYYDTGYIFAKNMCPKSNVEGATHYYALAFYGMATNELFFVYDTEKHTSTLCTCSTACLNYLITNGLLKDSKGNDVTVEAISKRLFGTGMKNSIENGDSFVCVKLTPDFKGSKRSYKYSLAKAKTFASSIIVPYNSIEFGCTMLDSLFSQGCWKVRMGLPEGYKERYVTKHAGIINSVYKDEYYATEVCKHARTLVDELKMYVPVLGASKMSAGVTDIKPLYLDTIELVNINKISIDTSMLDFDFGLATQYMADTVSKMDKTTLMRLKGYMNFNSEASMLQQLRFEIMSELGKKQSHVLYEFMKAHQDIFNIQILKGMRRPYHKMNQPVQPKTLQELSNILNSHVCKIRFTTNAGVLRVLDVTNSTELLENIYGDTYIANFESDNVRVKRLIGFLNNHVGSLQEVQWRQYCSMCGLEGISVQYGVQFNIKGTVSAEAYAGMKEQLTAMLETLISDKKKPSIPNAITVRRADLITGHDTVLKQNVYASIAFNNIQSVTILC